jgi:hypothetical protein
MATIFTFDVVNTQTISGVVSTTEQITIDWGDESSGNYNGIDQNYSKDYGSAGNRTVTITATDESCLTKFTMTQTGAKVSFTLSDLPSGLTYFICGGSNTVSGTLSDLPSGLTYFTCAGSNTISGSLSDLPSGLRHFYCGGLNTVSDYSTKLWTSKPATFILSPASGGLSTAEVDQLLIDLDDDLVWEGGNRIELTGTNAPRSVVSNAAVASIEGEGAAVTTSNVLQLGNIYKITVTEINHFGTGLEVDDYFVSNGTETVNASNKVKQVTDCAATGALIISALGGAVRSWTSVDTGFNPNLACTYEISRIEGTRLSPPVDLTSVGTATGSTIEWSADVPESTTLTIYSGLSESEEEEPASWDECTSGAPIPSVTMTDMAGKYLWLKQYMTTAEEGVSPSLSSISVEITGDYTTDSQLAYGTVSNGDVFIFLPVRIKLPDDTDEGPGEMQLEIDNVHRAYTETIRSVYTPVTCQVDIVMDNALDTIDASWPEFKLTNITYNATTITGTLKLETLETEPFPSGSFVPSYFPGLFG